MTERAIDVVHVGSASRDLTDDDPRGWRLGGGVSYAALATARFGLRTAAVIGVDAMAASASELDLLRGAGVELALVDLREAPVFRNRETPVGRIQTSVAHGERLAVPSLPVAWSEAPVWSVVPVAGELGDDWAWAIPADALVALGWQGLLRDLANGFEVTRRAPARSPLLDRAGLVGVSRHDLEPGTNVTGLLGMLRVGARLIVTEGADGGRVLRRVLDSHARSRRYRAIVADRVVDSTGAGDVFLAALVASLVLPGSTGRTTQLGSRVDLRFAAAAASLVIEGPGLHGVPDRPAVLARLARDRTARSVAR